MKTVFTILIREQIICQGNHDNKTKRKQLYCIWVSDIVYIIYMQIYYIYANILYI